MFNVLSVVQPIRDHGEMSKINCRSLDTYMQTYNTYKSIKPTALHTLFFKRHTSVSRPRWAARSTLGMAFLDVVRLACSRHPMALHEPPDPHMAYTKADETHCRHERDILPAYTIRNVVRNVLIQSISKVSGCSKIQNGEIELVERTATGLPLAFH